MIDLICPECAQGKHPNCTRMVPTEEIVTGDRGTVAEVWKPCACHSCARVR